MVFHPFNLVSCGCISRAQFSRAIYPTRGIVPAPLGGTSLLCALCDPPPSMTGIDNRVLLVALAERGQACLIPVPHYAGFDWAFKEAEIEPWPVMATGGPDVGLDAGISPALLEETLR